MKFNLYIIFFCVLVILGCKPNIEELKGHWHSVNENGSLSYNTLDISDSIVIIDATTLVGLDKYKFPLYASNGMVQLPIPREDYYPEQTVDYFIDDDTLYMGTSQIKYIKNAFNNCRSKDLFADQMVEVNLHNCSGESMSEESVNANYLLSHITVGRLKKSAHSKQIDSIVIQVNDVIITPKDLQGFVIQEKDVFDVHKKIGFCLNIDRNTPKALIDSIYLNLNKVLTPKYIFKSCFDLETKEIMYY